MPSQHGGCIVSKNEYFQEYSFSQIQYEYDKWCIVIYLGLYVVFLVDQL